FTYTISDGHGGSATAGVTVTVSPRPNRPPVAVDDAATTAFQTPIAINVLANDSDPDGDPLAISGVTTPANGAVSASGGTITYTPANGFSGIDRFTYSIDDGRGGTATANVTVTVGARPNQLPIANNDAATTVSGTPVTITVLANDSDPDGDPLTLQSVTTPGFGSAAISGTVIVYTPAAGVVGTDTFNYTINDGRGGTATATVTVTVTPPPNQPPTAFDDATTTAFATPVTIDAIANDSDPDGDALTIISVTTPAGGTAVINNNRIDYAPSRAFSGLDTFAYTISDGHGHTATANISVDVLPIPRPR
ncbi:MAG: Ig-like domain-containing protein, partial [Rhodanobacteraceae bacterium]